MMLRKAAVSFRAPSFFLLRNSARFQSTFQESATIEQLQNDMENVKPLTDQEIQGLSQLFDQQKPFSIFPSIDEVKPEDLVGATQFGKGSYFVERTSTGNLPVYSEFKRNGKFMTEIRRIRGDPIQLRNDLQDRLPSIPKNAFRVVMQSKKILIEGDAVKDVKEILSTTF